MKNLGGSVILLLVALVLLWLAVTNQLGRLLDAWDVVRGKATSSGASANNNINNPSASAGAPATNASYLPSLPSLPALGVSPLVGA